MVNPQFEEQKPLSLSDVKGILVKIEKRDQELSYRSTKAKEYLESFIPLDDKKKEELFGKLHNLKQTRLKDEHMMKIVDFLPTTVDELKIILQSYPLSLPKKDMETIVGVVKDFA